MKCFVLAGFLFACNKADPGPTCEKVMDHVLDIMKSGMTGHEGMNVGDRKQMIAQCETRKLAKTVRTCILAAKDITAIANCSLPPPPDPSAGSAAPAGSGTPHP